MSFLEVIEKLYNGGDVTLDLAMTKELCLLARWKDIWQWRN